MVPVAERYRVSGSLAIARVAGIPFTGASR